jgi:hypothetical protein
VPASIRSLAAHLGDREGAGTSSGHPVWPIGSLLHRLRINFGYRCGKCFDLRSMAKQMPGNPERHRGQQTACRCQGKRHDVIGQEPRQRDEPDRDRNSDPAQTPRAVALLDSFRCVPDVERALLGTAMQVS